MIKKDDTISNRKDSINALFHQQDSDTIIPQGGKGFPDPGNHRGLKPLGRLIKQQHLGADGQRPRHGQHLLLPAGEGIGTLFHSFFKPGEHRQQFGPPRAGIALAVRHQSDFDIFSHRQLTKQPPALRNIADPAERHLMRGPVRYHSAINPNVTAERPDQAHDGLKTGCLARAVAAKEADDFACIYRQRHILQNARPAITR